MSAPFVIFMLFMLLRFFARLFWPNNRRRIFFEARRVAQDLVDHSGGNIFNTGGRRFIYVPDADQKMQAEINCNGQPKIKIRISKAFPLTAAFYRVSRLPYAFLEAFISPDLRMQDAPYFTVSARSTAIPELKNKAGFQAVFERVNRGGFSFRIEDRSLTLWKSLRTRDINEFAFQEAIRLARDLAQICAGEIINIPIQPLHSEKHCAYCKESIFDNASVMYCTQCGTPHHRECFELNGKCSVYGCNSDLVVPARETTVSFS